MEARGVEPLSIKRSARPSTCLGDLCCRSAAADRHATDSQASTKSNSPYTAVAPAEGQPAVIVSVLSRRQPGHVTAR